MHDRFGENYVLPSSMPRSILPRMGRTDPHVRWLEPAERHDAGLVARLTDLVNEVYASAESGLWRSGTPRTTADEIAELIAAGEIAVATVDGDIAGCVRIHDVSGDASEFGLLTAAPEQRGIGIGRALLDFAEHDARERGRRAMQLELLLPRAWRHPSKEFLKAWYGRRGYRFVRSGSLDGAYPQLAPLLATPCELTVHEKPLRGP
jgi:GNAT superfamily N-acetyltransferase